MRGLPISKRLVVPALAQFIAATAGRNMTKAAYAAVTIGVGVMVLLTFAPAYEAAHHWVDAVLWACWAYFAFEWAVRLRRARQSQRAWTYVLSGRGLVDAIAAIAIPLAFSGVEAKRRGCSGVPGSSRWFRASRDCASCDGCWCRNPARCSVCW